MPWQGCHKTCRAAQPYQRSAGTGGKDPGAGLHIIINHGVSEILGGGALHIILPFIDLYLSNLLWF